VRSFLLSGGWTGFAHQGVHSCAVVYCSLPARWQWRRWVEAPPLRTHNSLAAQQFSTPSSWGHTSTTGARRGRSSLCICISAFGDNWQTKWLLWVQMMKRASRVDCQWIGRRSCCSGSRRRLRKRRPPGRIKGKWNNQIEFLPRFPIKCFHILFLHWKY